MGPFDCTVVPKPALDPAPAGALFWPANRTRLVLLFQTLTDDTMSVLGIDPDVAKQSAIVFHADLLLAQKDRFVQAVREGREPTQIPSVPVSNENRNRGATASAARKSASARAAKPSMPKIQGDAIVIIDRPGNDPGPKYRLELPSSGAARATGTRG